MRKKSCLVKLIIGESGASAAVATAFTFGLIPLPSSFQMDPTGGSVSSWTENLQQCTRAEAPKTATKVQVS